MYVHFSLNKVAKHLSSFYSTTLQSLIYVVLCYLIVFSSETASETSVSGSEISASVIFSRRNHPFLLKPGCSSFSPAISHPTGPQVVLVPARGGRVEDEAALLNPVKKQTETFDYDRRFVSKATEMAEAKAS